MSLGNNIDNSDFEQSEILREVAEKMVLKGLSRDDAISMVKKLRTRREEAEKSGQVVLGEEGHGMSYHDTDLNLEPVPASQNEAVVSAYHKLCEDVGIDALWS